MTRVAVLLPLALMAGCASAPRMELQRVNVPVPVECREPVLERPEMPTEALAPGVDPFTLMRAALEICTKPIKP